MIERTELRVDFYGSYIYLVKSTYKPGIKLF